MTLEAKKLAEKYLDEPAAGRMTVQYRPTGVASDESAPKENPPRFSWLPTVDDDARYVLRVSTDKNFPKNGTNYFENISYNFFTPDSVFTPGVYYWSYAEWSPATKAVASQWSQIREFTLASDLPETPLASRQDRYSHSTTNHPRLWLQPDGIKQFQQSLAKDKNHANWQKFYEESVVGWMDREVMAEPAAYPNNTRTPPVWRQTYIDCQELLYAIRSYTDEWAYRVTLALAWGYDWLYNELTEDERTLVRKSLLARTRQVAEHAIDSAKIHLFPYDSHAVRSVSAVMVPACIAIMDEEPEALEWLDYSIEFLSNLYSPWGDSDGGWAEGPHYWMTGIAYLR